MDKHFGPAYQSLPRSCMTEKSQWQMGLSVYKTSYGMLLQRAYCNCHIFSHETGTVLHLTPFFLQIFSQDKLWETGHQNLVYDLIALFCDIGMQSFDLSRKALYNICISEFLPGNSVGLLLGASVLTVVEALEWGFISFIRCILFRAQKSRVGPAD